MLKSHEKFHSTNGKRLILVADDEMINREILGHLLSQDYEVLYAEDGRQALDLIRMHRDTLSLVLLDLLMPVMSGMEVLTAVRRDPELSNIPVIVVTSDQSAEVESLGIGATDFISKPYPQPGVILARVLRTIELSEDREIIQSTERDPLTGLYNKEFFYRYAEQFDQHHKDLSMDAIIVDINHFRIINERYGKAYGDEVLRRIGERLREMVQESGGIVCRREADTFMVYCPHRTDYKDILDYAFAGLSEETQNNNHVRLRMGVYSLVDKEVDIERRFDWAKHASDTVRNSFSKAIAIYDDTLHQAELYEEQLIEDFRTAIREEQFVVFYQPKFDIRPDIPMLASAEALVRWKHPRLGMISPGVFIPLFEENGLIEELDLFVWQKAAAQIHDWKKRFGISVPVSVNVSRVDMYNPNLIDTFLELLRKHALQPSEFLLEITESAYTEDSAQIISTVNRLRGLGFKVEMDDFGTGYSSLNMISSLPIDALKLDMKFIREAFKGERDTRMIEVIIDIADYLSVPVIAEGVETQEQLETLRAMGCDIVQGYYFSKPVPPAEYERFVEARSHLAEANSAHVARSRRKALRPAERASALTNIAHALTTGFESIYYVDAESGRYVQFSARGRYEDLQIEQSGDDFFSDTQRTIKRVVFKEDQDRVALSLERDALLTQLMGGQCFSMIYRLVINGTPLYYNLRAVRSLGAQDDHHIVIGVSNVQDQMHQAMLSGAARDKGREFLSIANALSSDFESIYYVDVLTNAYSEVPDKGAVFCLKNATDGADFFEDFKSFTQMAVCPEDRYRLTRAMRKQELLSALKEEETFSILFRLSDNGKPVEYSLKAVRMEDDETHLVIGVSNVAAQMQRQREYEAAKEETVTFSSIARALAADYFDIYYVDEKTDRFTEFSAHEDSRGLNEQRRGEGFFSYKREEILSVAFPEDKGKILLAFTKDNLMRALEQEGTFSITYRLMIDSKPVYMNMKATRMTSDEGNSHIVIGISNVDAQIKREQELNDAREKANRDALTGVKSKHAYLSAEADLNASIERGEAVPFALAVCDVNGVKRINDSQGHQAGDQLIKAASAVICNIFKHSPVFRTGGDEFVALLRGQDYERRQDLLEEMARRNEENMAQGGPVIAAGYSEFVRGADVCLADLFQRADGRMYENKNRLKEISGYSSLS